MMLDDYWMGRDTKHADALTARFTPSVSSHIQIIVEAVYKAS